MYIRTALVAALSAIILMVIPLSADHSGAEYQGKVLIENSGTAVSGVTVRLDLNTDALIDGGMLDSTFDNIWFTNAGGNSMAFMPKPGATGQWYFHYPWSLPASSSVLSYLYMGGPDMSPPIYYFPGSTGMAAADAATLEPGTDWTAEVKGYITMPADNSGTPGKLIYKNDCVWLGTMQHGIMALVARTGGSFTPVGTPTGFQDPGAIWAQEASGYDNNTASGADLGSVAGKSWSPYLILEQPPAVKTAAISFYAESDADWTQIDIDAYYNGAWNNVYTGAYANLAYVQKWLPGVYEVSEFRLRFYNNNVAAQTELDILRNFRFLCRSVAVSLLYAPLTPGSYTVQLDFANPTVNLSVNGVVRDTDDLAVAGELNPNANAWALCDAASVSYMEYYKAWQGATLRQHIVWENDTTFTDLSGNGNDATPSFPAASSDPDVSASLLSLTPLAPSDAPGGTTESGGLVPGVPAEPEGMYREMEMDHLPGAALINSLLDAGGIPRTLFWFPLVFIGIVVLGLLTYRVTKSLMGMGLVASVALVFASRVGIVPYWVTIPLILIAVAILVKEKMSPL